MPLDILPQLIVLALAKNEGREVQRKAAGDLVIDRRGVLLRLEMVNAR